VRGRFAYLALAINLCIPLATAQPARVTGGESHILSAFTSGADPRVLSGGVTLGPALRAELGAETDSRKVYEALVERIGGRRLRVDPVPPAEAVRYASLPGVTPGEQLIWMQAGELVLLLQYAAAQKNVTFVERLSKPAPRSETPKPGPKPEPPVVVASPKPEPPPVTAVPLPAAPEPPPTPVIEKPKPPAVTVQKPAPARPRGECVIKPVMTEDDLYNCSGPVPSAAIMSAPAAPATADKPAASAPQAPRECVIKAVMTDEELRACAAVSRASSAPVMERPVAPEKPAAAAPQPPQPPRECVIKAVMSDEELRACGVRR